MRSFFKKEKSMKQILVIPVLLATLLCGADLQEKNFDEYMRNFTDSEPKNMNIDSAQMLELVQKKEAVVIDIRFAKEHKAWNFGFMKHIPLNELPKNLDKLPKDKLIIVACPLKDRSNVARTYLMLKGFNVKYLNDGLLKTADILRGKKAIEFMDSLE